MDTHAWPELLPFVFQCAQSGEPRLAEPGLLIFAALATPLAGTLRQYLGTLHAVLASCFASPSTDVSSAAVRATVAFVHAADGPPEREALAGLVPAVLGAVGAALNAGDQVAAQA